MEINDDNHIINNNISRSTLLDIPYDKLNICKDIIGCPISFDIELDKQNLKNGSSYPIEISISTPKKTPFQLQKNVIRRFGVNDNQINYYYFEVEKNEEGEIILDVKRGSGIMYAKIVEKDIFAIFAGNTFNGNNSGQKNTDSCN